MAFVVTYTYSYDDYLALIRAKRAMSIFGGVGGVVHYVLLSAAYLLGIAALTDWRTTSLADLVAPRSLAIIVGGVVGICVAIALIDVFFDRVLYRVVFRRYALANAELSLAVDDEGIRWSGKGISANLAWPRVKRVYLGRDHVFGFIS